MDSNRSDRFPVKSAVVTQSRIIALMYASLGLVSLTGFLDGVNWWVVIGVVLPLVVGGTEGFLGWKYATSGRLIWIKWLFWHQIWTWAWCVLCLFLLKSIDLEAYMELIPKDIWQQYVDQLAQVGIDPIAYLQGSWTVTLLLMGILFTVKIAYLALNYRKWIRELMEV